MTERTRSLLLVLGLLLGASGCRTCDTNDLLARAAAGEARAIHELGETGDPLIPPGTPTTLRYDQALKVLAPHLTSEDPFLRLHALEAIRRVGQRAPSFFRDRTPDLLDGALRHEDPRLRWRAAWALGRMKLTRPALRAALGDPHPRVAERAAWALGQARDRQGEPGLLALLESKAPQVAQAAAQALNAIHERQRELKEWRAWARERPASRPTTRPAEAKPPKPQPKPQPKEPSK